MKKSTCLFLVILCLSLLTGCSKPGENGRADAAGPESAAGPEVPEEPSTRNDPLWSDADSLKAMVISDLHYTEYKEVDPMIVPGIALAEEITDAIVAEVIDRHPDVFIMTGDNTNSGYEKDAAGLTAKLQKIRGAGIPLILTTGNHDLDLMSEEEFEQMYYGLLDPVDRDPASLSYTAIVKDVVFLAMDDNALNSGVQGEFADETVEWLGSILAKYRDHRIIFLSHHNVLYGYGEDDTGSHLIQNPELPQLLHDGGVKLALTGHMHFQYVTEQDGLWEVLSGMPFSGKHLIGNLAVGRDRLVYYAEPIDFEKYGGAVKAAGAGSGSGKDSAAGGKSGKDSAARGGSMKDELDRLDRESAEYMEQVFGELLDTEGVRGSKKKKVLALISRYLQYYGEGTLAEHAQELREDPSCERMIKALWDYNYGPWMKAMIETTVYSARELEVKW